MTSPETTDATTLHLGPILDLKAAAGLHAELLKLRGVDLLLDAHEVQRLGGQCLQVLLAALTAWRADGKALSVVSPSEAFIQALTLFGLNPASFEYNQQKEQTA
jgi:chemotaxis protein CheX